ncbi:hypothetical protein A0257_01995 [Hymenobacter psoromatis]|nr:hypothetical protein A0257_01995 [Hymenobacter psoromatis]
MHLTEITYSAAQQQFHLRGLGVVLDTVILAADQPVADVYAASRAATQAGMAILAEQLERFYGDPATAPPNCFTIRIFPEPAPRGTRISFADFIGLGYDLATRELRLFNYSPGSHSIVHMNPEGLAYALLNPPYGLRFARAGRFANAEYAASETQFYDQLLRDYLALFLGVRQPDDVGVLTIFAWSDDWSNYFEAGQEWWGAFCWTVYDARMGTIAFLAASSTD